MPGFLRFSEKMVKSDLKNIVRYKPRIKQAVGGFCMVMLGVIGIAIEVVYESAIRAEFNDISMGCSWSKDEGIYCGFYIAALMMILLIMTNILLLSLIFGGYLNISDAMDSAEDTFGEGSHLKTISTTSSSEPVNLASEVVNKNDLHRLIDILSEIGISFETNHDGAYSYVILNASASDKYVTISFKSGSYCFGS